MKIKTLFIDLESSSWSTSRFLSLISTAPKTYLLEDIPTFTSKSNESKTISILFGCIKATRVKKLMINNIPLTWSLSVKYLGITINRNLNFKTYVTNITKKVTTIRGSLHPVLNSKSPILWR